MSFPFSEIEMNVDVFTSQLDVGLVSCQSAKKARWKDSAYVSLCVPAVVRK